MREQDKKSNKNKVLRTKVNGYKIHALKKLEWGEKQEGKFYIKNQFYLYNFLYEKGVNETIYKQLNTKQTRKTWKTLVPSQKLKVTKEKELKKLNFYQI